MLKKNTIHKVLDDLGYATYHDSEMEKLQSEWLQWYQGYVRNFHSYKNYQGTDIAQTIKRYSLGMWKVISELWADNMWNPETTVTIGNEQAQSWWDIKQQDINFVSNFNNLQEKTFALGTTATNCYKGFTGLSEVDYLDHNVIIPLEVNNSEVLSVAFASQYDKDTVYLNIHERQADDTYIIYNLFYSVDDNGEIGEQVYLQDLQEEVRSPIKLFQVHKPAIVNNKVLDSPFGVSVLGNAIDEIKATDIAFDALTKEAEYGKIRVYLKSGALDFDVDGKTTKVFNPNQEEFYVLKGDDQNDEGELVTVSAPTLRVQELVDSLNNQLNLLGRKAGLGDNTFSSDEGTIYTNTAQIISTNSRFFKTREKHGQLMKNNIVEIVKALYWLEFNRELTDSISVHMDDSIIHDKEDELNRVIQLNREGIISDVYVIQTLLDMTEEQAVAFLDNQRKLQGLEEEQPEVE